MKRLPYVLMLAGLLLLEAQAAPIRVLILTGSNNHDWRTTTPALRQALERTGRFQVDVQTNVDAMGPQSFAAYDVLLSNYNTFNKQGAEAAWNPETRAAFLAFVRGGRGFVTVHAGSSSYYDWPEYQQLACASWKNGQTAHNAPHTFTVAASDAKHPVTDGMAPFTTTDELWLKPGVDPAATVLAAAEGQPVALASAFGKGRGFALLLGHSAAFMANTGFQSLLARGTEWAATGAATITAVDLVLPDLAAYQYGQSRAPLLEAARLIQLAPREWAPRLTALLDGDATADAKKFACEQLSLIGTDAEVPALARRLADTNLSFAARFALERIPGAASLAALRDALPAAAGESRTGLLLALGARGDGKAVPAIASLLPDPAAIDALGGIATQPALDALAAAESAVPAADRARWSLAMLHCAGRLGALPALQKLSAAGHPEPVRIAAFAASAGGDAVLAALSGSDPVLQRAALAALRARPDAKLAGAVAGRLDTLPPAFQAQLLTLFAACGERAALPAAVKSAASEDPAVRQAALEALGALGDASAVPAIVARLERTADAAERKALATCLAQMKGDGVGRALLDAATKSTPGAQPELIRALVARNTAGAVPFLIAAAGGSDEASRREAIQGLRQMADANALPGLIALLDRAAESDRAALETALGAACRRAGAVAPVVKALGAAAPAAKASLAAALGQAGGPDALPALRALLKDPDSAVQLATVRALAAWADAAPLEDLVSAAESTQDAKLKALALRGVAQLVPLAKDRSAKELAPLVRRALAASGRAEDTAVLQGVLDALTANNLARGATATNLDGLEPDHDGRGPAAAIDGDPATYWDETDDKNLYWLKVALPRPANVVRLRVMGFKQQEYAPKDLEVLCDGKVVKAVTNLAYVENVAAIDLPATRCSAIELKITGRYGPSPAIRELEIIGEEVGP